MIKNAFAYEHLFLVGYMALLYLMFESDRISRATWADAHTSWNIILVFLLLVSMNVRIVLGKIPARRFVLPFSLGFIFGPYQWLVFALNEFYSIGAEYSIANIVSLIFGIASAGTVTGLIAAGVSVILGRIVSRF